MMGRHRIAIASIALILATDAQAWSRPGHMVTAAIAYRVLAADHPDRLRELLDIVAAHPDRGPFEVAIDRATGEEKQRRLFYECARWPDDTRGTLYDHPTWHYAARPVRRATDTAPSDADAVTGAANEAFALNLKVLNDRLAPKPDRAVALCWIMHLVGDIHQPLHTAERVSREFPDGDRLGSRQFVRETPTDEAVTLHWFWDDRVHRSGTIDSVEAAATRIGEEFSATNTENKLLTDPVRAFALWGSDESHAIAARDVYSDDLRASPDAASAPVATGRYREVSRTIAERRIVQAGRRLALVLSATP